MGAGQCKCARAEAAGDSDELKAPNEEQPQWASGSPRDSEEQDAKAFEDFDKSRDFVRAISSEDFDKSIDAKVTADRALYAWMGWGPDEGSPCYKTLHRCFPGAIPGEAVVKRTANALEPFGLTQENTIYGQSICPDEINNEKGDLATLMSDYWGTCFPMGGIGGAPFVGKTGFSAFSHHVPDDGHIVILFGPHIAISESGELGKYLRTGQCKHSTACGAVLAAYDAAVSGNIGEFDKNDVQQCFLKDRISKRLGTIQGSKEPLNSLIHEAYSCVEEALMKIVNNDFGSGHLVLIGGIQINMPQPCEDHFQPLLFQVIDKDTEPVDILHEFNIQKMADAVVSSEGPSKD